MVMDEESGQAVEVRRGDHYLCPNWSCEIGVRHHGNPERIERSRPFTCCCGTEMRKEPE
jgi:hypothetical protein